MVMEWGSRRPIFHDRHGAGRALATHLEHLAGRDVLVLGLPRGGVPVAYEIALALGAELDVFVVRKLGSPWNEEFAIGAIASGGIVVLDDRTIDELGIPRDELDRVIAREEVEVARREHAFRGDRPFPDLTDRTVILVDDGLATGATMRVAVDAVRQRRPAHIIAAAPVASFEACDLVARAADAVVCPATPEPFYGVGLWYEDFSQTTDEEVIGLLDQARARRRPQPPEMWDRGTEGRFPS